MPTLSVVIVSFNVASHLRKCLESLRQDQGIAFETIVVDNGSSDGSAAIVKTEFPEVALITSAHNGGYAYANNLGLRQARGRFLLLLNPDTIVPAGALGRLVAFLEANPHAGVVGPKLLLPDGSLDLACRRSFPTPEVSLYRMLGLSRLLPRSRRFGRYNLTYLDPDETAEVDSVVGACMLVRREAVDQVGLLDETFFMYGEDLDWSFRIKAAGWKVYYYPDVVIHHIKRASSRHAGFKVTYEFYRAMALFYRKHYASQTPLPVHLLVLFGIVLWGGATYLQGAVRAFRARRTSRLAERIGG